MHKAQLDRLLEQSVADALGVQLPAHHRLASSGPRHPAKAPRRHRHMTRVLQPA